MRPELRSIIERFRRDQELGLDFLHGKLGIPVPATCYDWAAMGREQIEDVDSIVRSNGARLQKHGIGIEIIHPKFRIDFDYGPNGECNCFDAWRLQLHEHILKKYSDPVSCLKALPTWLAEAADAGFLRLLSKTHSVYICDEFPTKWNTESESTDSR